MGAEVKPGWIKTKRTAIAGDFPEFVYTNEKPGAIEIGVFTVAADHTGVRFRGTSLPLTKDSEFDNLAWVVADAAREFLKFKRARIQLVGDNEVGKINAPL